MPPPASYIDIDTIPFSVVVPQADFNIDDERWFRLVLAADAVAGFFIEIGGTFTPRYDLFESDGSTLVKTQNSASNVAWWFPLEAGTYYLQVTRRLGGSSDFDFTFQADTKPLGGFAVDEEVVVINDDTGLFPAAVIRMDGTIVGYLEIPAGEIGAAIPSGVSLWQDRFGRRSTAGTLALFSASGVYVTSTAQVFSDFPIPVSIAASATHFFAHEPTTGEVYRITSAGVVTLVATIPQATSIGVSEDGTVLYYANAFDYLNAFDPSDNVIHRWDLVNDVALADFYTVADLATDVGGIAVTANFWPGEILELPDGSVVTWARNEDAEHDILLHIDSGGSLLHSYQYEHAVRQIDHIQRALGGGSESVNVWWYTAPTGAKSVGRVAELVLDDGTDTVGFDTALFSQGLNMVVNTGQLIGPSTSCAMVTMLLLLEVPSPSPGSPGGEPGNPEDGEIGPIAWVEEWEDDV